MHSPYPVFLYNLAWDLFAVVRCWTPPACTGPERGRLFEQVFYKYCDRKRLPLSERSGSRTLDGASSASGFQHESDGVIATPDVNAHIELKHLTQPVSKLDLVSFNQKGLDFLAGDNTTLRRKPLYRVLVTATPVEMTARVFALQWGILLIEPNKLPLLALHVLAKRALGTRWSSTSEQRIVDEIPSLVVPVQERIRRLASVLGGDRPLVSKSRVDWILNAQNYHGARYWRILDADEPTWIEDRYDAAVGDTRCLA
jgi:hypothetical protein